MTNTNAAQIATLAAGHLERSVRADDTNGALMALADNALDFIAEMEEDGRKDHDEILAEGERNPLHGSEYEPCGICNPYDRSEAVHALYEILIEQREDEQA